MIKKLFLLLAFVSVACSYQVDQSENSKALNKFEDPAIQEIADFQDKRYTDSLISIIKEENTEYDAEVAMALASVQDKNSISTLTNLLNHQNPEVKKAAAYALGQTYDSSAFTVLIKNLNVETDPVVRKYLLEAAGKTVKSDQLEKLLSIRLNSKEDAEGMAWAIYRSALRNITSLNSTFTALNILDTTSSSDARLAAAHYLGRARDISIPDWGFIVLKNKVKIEDPEVRMAIASAYKNVPSQISFSVLTEFLADEDYRVVINAIRVLSKPILQGLSDEKIISLLQHANPNVGIAMAEKIIAAPDTKSASKYSQWIEMINNRRVKSLLYQAILKQKPDNMEILDKVKEEYLSASSPYYKAQLLSVFSETLPAYEFLITETFKASHPAISTAGISSLAILSSDPSFPETLHPAFADIFKQAIESGDPAMIAISSDALRNPNLRFREYYENYSFLYNARDNLELPKENETLQSLSKTIAYFEGREANPIENEFNHPINWSEFRTISSRQEAVIRTNKGDINIYLYADESPGSVLNFVNLSKSGYYDNRVFHRVVPNFVVQGGGNRGDGYGGESYSIRSELADLKYKTGSIGMASAGKDTEGTQWFITHSPTPHLDGRYTIFAQVQDGMDVVHHLEVGDSIHTIIIKE